MGEHEGAVGEVEDVELDEVDADLDPPPEHRQGVLRPERRGPAVADPQHAGAASKLRQVLRMTPPPQSSVRSPPVKARQPSTTARASAAAAKPACAASMAASRAAP